MTYFELFLHFEHLFFPCGASNFAGVATSVVSLMVPVAFHVKDWVPIWTGYWMGSSTCVRSEVGKYQNLECERKHSGFEKNWNAPGLGSMSHCVDLPGVKILLQHRTRAPEIGIQWICATDHRSKQNYQLSTQLYKTQKHHKVKLDKDCG